MKGQARRCHLVSHEDQNIGAFSAHCSPSLQNGSTSPIPPRHTKKVHDTQIANATGSTGVRRPVPGQGPRSKRFPREPSSTSLSTTLRNSSTGVIIGENRLCVKRDSSASGIYSRVGASLISPGRRQGRGNEVNASVETENQAGNLGCRRKETPDLTTCAVRLPDSDTLSLQCTLDALDIHATAVHPFLHGNGGRHSRTLTGHRAAHHIPGGGVRYQVAGNAPSRDQ